MQWTPGRAGTITRAGNPWSGDRSTPLTQSASSASGSSTWFRCSHASLNPPPPSSDCTWAFAGWGTPARSARSARRTPVHRWVVDHPSTQAIGRSAVCWRMAMSVARSSVTSSVPPVRDSRHVAPVAEGSIDAADAVLLTWKSFGPSPYERPRGMSRAASRADPADALPDGQHGDEQRTAAHQGERPPAAQCGWRRVRRDEAVGVGRLGLGRRPGASAARRRRDRERRLRTMVGNLSATWTTNPVMKTQAPK